MELNSITKLNDLFKNTSRALIIIVAIISLTSTLGYIYLFKEMSELQKNVLVLDKTGGAFTATAVDASYMRVYEYENHVKTFVNLWYAFDEYNYESNIASALELIGEPGKELLAQYKDVNMLNLLRQKNIHYNVQIKDISVNMNTIPTSGKIILTQTGVRPRGQSSREILVEFTLSDVSRSRENIHGCKIDSWIATTISQTQQTAEN